MLLCVFPDAPNCSCRATAGYGVNSYLGQGHGPAALQRRKWRWTNEDEDDVKGRLPAGKPHPEQDCLSLFSDLRRLLRASAIQKRRKTFCVLRLLLLVAAGCRIAPGVPPPAGSRPDHLEPLTAHDQNHNDDEKDQTKAATNPKTVGKHGQQFNLHKVSFNLRWQFIRHHFRGQATRRTAPRLWGLTRPPA